MIILSAGMQKAGTGWYFNMTNDLLVESGYHDARNIRDTYRLQAIMKFHNCNIGKPMLPKLALLLIPVLLGNTFVVKTHANPSPTLRVLTAPRLAKSTYIYRDPRDAALSAFEHGVKIRQAEETHSFARLTTMESAIRVTQDWINTWEAWQSFPNTLLTRYEDLLADPLHELKRLAEFLQLEVDAETLSQIMFRYQKEPLENENNPLHFNKGVTGRFRQEMTAGQKQLCDQLLGPHLEKMGYQSK